MGENGSHTMWTDESEKSWYYENKLNLRAKGYCLEFGLGLGFASEIILSNPEVKQLKTLEMNLDVITVQDMVNPILDDRHAIVNASMEEYLDTTEDTFDFVFIDTYITTGNETLSWLEDIVPKIKSLLNPGGEVMAWLDFTSSEEEKKRFYNILNT